MKAEIIKNNLILFPETNTEDYAISIFLEGPIVNSIAKKKALPIEIDRELILERDV